MLNEMLINGVDVQNYNARLLTYSVSGTTLTNNTFSNSSLLKMPSLFKTTLGTRQLNITLTFKPSQIGSDSKGMSVTDRLATATDNISRFEAEIIGKTVELTLPDGYIYTALVTSITAASFDASGEHDVSYTFNAIRHKPQEIVSIKPNTIFYCKSTTATPCKFIVVPHRDFDSVAIMGIKVNNLTENSEYIIDGINSIITLDGVNKFIDTDCVDFPCLMPGENIISSETEDVEITIVYTPIYV